MNSYEILKNLRRLVNDKSLGTRQREIARMATQHIEKQDNEILELREDITDVTIPEED
jgi:hypothetical protein